MAARVHQLLAPVDQFDGQVALIAQLTSPFLVYSIIFNFLVGIMNKMTPLIPVYFISTPFVLAVR